MAPSKTITIIGASGFIGSHLVPSLLQNAERQVRLLVHQRRPAGLPGSDRVQLVEANLLDKKSLKGLIRSGDTVINLAYLSGASPTDNIQAVENLAQACRSAGDTRIVHCSTAVVAGSTPADLVDEMTPCVPTTTYELTKLAIERTLLNSAVTEVSVLRPTAVFGSGGRNLLSLAQSINHPGRFATFLKRSLHGNRRMNAVGVGNVIAALEFLIRTDIHVDREIFIVSDDEYAENNYSDIEQWLCDYFSDSKGTWYAERSPQPPLLKGGRLLPSFPVPRQLLSGLLWMARRSNTNPNRIYDGSKLLRAGFVKPFGFEQSLADFADWFRLQYPIPQLAGLTP